MTGSQVKSRDAVGDRDVTPQKLRWNLKMILSRPFFWGPFSGSMLVFGEVLLSYYDMSCRDPKMSCKIENE